MEVYEAIKNGIGSEMSEAQVWALVAVSQTRYYDGGATIVRQFERNADLMIVLEGSVRIESMNGGQIMEAGPGSILGEVSLIDDQPRSATIRSIRGTRIAVIPHEKLMALMQQSAALESAMFRHLCRLLCLRLRHANLRIDKAS
jgi:CRP/FNR family transcriptional regulator, cyclic AMP receptor protein